MTLIFGGSGNDTITISTNSSGGILSSAAQDNIFGVEGDDLLTGGAGGDRFRYLAVSDSTAADGDVILDFTHSVAAGIDKVDLTAIDANSLVAGNQAFTYIGNAAFGGLGAASAGQLRYEVIDTDYYSIRGDVNGDGTEDFVTNIISTFAPQQSWFLL